MVEKKLTCASCKTSITNIRGSIEFDCPNCGKPKIVRCYKCRELGAKYICSQCGFSGPN